MGSADSRMSREREFRSEFRDGGDLLENKALLFARWELRDVVYLGIYPGRASQLREMQRGVTFNCTCMPQHAHLYSSAIATTGPRAKRANERTTGQMQLTLMRTNMPAFRLASSIIEECTFFIVIIHPDSALS